MTYEATLVFDQTIQSGQIYISNTFTKARFLLIDTVNLPLNEKFDLGFSLNVTIPTPSRLVTKNISLLPETVIGVFDTFYIVPIPLELSESQYNLNAVVSFGDDADDTQLRIYAYTSDANEQIMLDKLNEIIRELTGVRELQTFDVLEDVAQIANSIQNNVAFGILSASLVPVTAGASAAALPPLSIGSAALTSLLLPGV